MDPIHQLKYPAQGWSFCRLQIRNECIEIEEHLHSVEQREALQEEIGDWLHAAFSLCVFCDFDSLS